MINLFALAIKLLFILSIMYCAYLLIIKKTHKAIVILIASSLILLIMLNPNRAKFNHAVYEGGSNLITENQEIAKNIHDTCVKERETGHRLIKRKYYLLFSIYDVHVSDTKVYHVLGFLDVLKLI